MAGRWYQKGATVRQKVRLENQVDRLEIALQDKERFARELALVGTIDNNNVEAVSITIYPEKAYVESEKLTFMQKGRDGKMVIATQINLTVKVLQIDIFLSEFVLSHEGVEQWIRGQLLDGFRYAARANGFPERLVELDFDGLLTIARNGGK